MDAKRSSPGCHEALSRTVFLDTEFTDFKSPRLLSLGLVSSRWLRSRDREHGDGWVTSAPTHLYHLYLETADQRRIALSSQFCKETVLPQFGLVEGCAVADDAAMGARVAHWIRGALPEGNAPLVVVYDYLTDYELLMKLLHGAGQMRGAGSLLGRVRGLDIEDKTSVFAHLHEAGVMDLSRSALARAHRAFDEAHLAALEFFDGCAARDNAVPPGTGRHHALVDAMALACRWGALVDAITTGGAAPAAAHP